MIKGTNFCSKTIKKIKCEVSDKLIRLKLFNAMKDLPRGYQHIVFDAYENARNVGEAFDLDVAEHEESSYDSEDD